MNIDEKLLSEGVRKILEVERSQLYGSKTGSDTNRRREVEKELNRVLDVLASKVSTNQTEQ
jgi:hypothetical protein